MNFLPEIKVMAIIKMFFFVVLTHGLVVSPVFSEYGIVNTKNGKPESEATVWYV